MRLLNLIPKEELIVNSSLIVYLTPFFRYEIDHLDGLKLAIFDLDFTLIKPK